jgi:hypothetical protein
VDPNTNSSFVIFGVGAEGARAAAMLDQIAAAARSQPQGGQVLTSRIFGMWVCNESQLPEIPQIGLGMKPNTSPGQEALVEMGDSAQANGHDHLKIESRTTV